jgi:hypothetical protein
MLALKENLNVCKLDEAGQRLVRVSLSNLAGQCEAALCAEAGQYHLFGLVRVYTASEDKRRKLCGVQKFSEAAVPTGLGFATRNYLGAE